MRTVPKIEPLSMERYDACPSSLAREWEMEYFYQEHGIKGLSDPKAAANQDKGVHLRPVLAQVPFGQVANLGVLLEAATVSQAITLQPGEAWYLHDCITKRDALIEQLIKRAGDQDVLLSAEYLTGAEGIFWDSGKGFEVEVVGLGDAKFVAEGPSGRHVLILDYSTGYTASKGDATDRHLTTLAGLEAMQHKGTISVEVAMLVKNDARPGEVSSAVYEQPALHQAAEWLRVTAADRAERLRFYEANRDKEGSPSPELSVALDQAAEAGDHCNRCKGGVCCGKLRQYLALIQNSQAEKYRPVFEQSRQMVKEAVALLPKHFASPNTTPLPMTIKTLATTLDASKTLVDVLALPKQLWEESAELTRQLAEKKEMPAGWALKDGARHLKLREKIPMLDAAGIEIGTRSVTPADTTPQAVFKAIESVLPGVSYDEFVNDACSVDPKSVEAMIADRAKVDPRAVFDRVLSPLGPKNPFEQKANKPSVIRSATLVQEDAAPLPKEAKQASKKTIKQ